LLLSLIVSSVVLAIGLSILEISVNQINLSSTARESEFAFQSAHAGIDCLTYWRDERASGFTAAVVGTAIPTITCFGQSPYSTPTKSRVQSNSSGYTDLFSFVFEWGSPVRCTEVGMYVMNATTGNLSLTFTNEAIGDDGVKTCNLGTKCTVVISRGYNRACNQLTSSIFTVQRELTVEF